MSHIFISYSRKDIDFAQKIVDALAANDLDTWIDWKSIPKGEDWAQEIYRGIEEADAFLFLIGPDSVASKMCNKEIAHAVENGKRILPIVLRDTDSKLIHPEISKRNWIFCRDGQDNFSKAIVEVQNTVHTDYEWLKLHTKIQLKALDWQRNRSENSFLVHGTELQDLVNAISIDSGKVPQVTDLQRQFMLASQKHEESLRWNAEQNRKLIIARELSLKAQTIIYDQKLLAETDNLIVNDDKFLSPFECGILLSIESLNTYPTFEGDQVLRFGLSTLAQMLRWTTKGQRLILTKNEFERNNVVKKVSLHSGYVRDFSFSPNGRYMATASEDCNAIVWDIKSDKVILKTNFNGPVLTAVFSPSGKYVAFASQDHTAKVLKMRRNIEHLAIIHDGPIGPIAFDPHERVLVTGSADCSVRIYNIQTKKEMNRLFQKKPIHQIAFSHDGNWLATCNESDEGILYSINVSSVKPISIFKHEWTQKLLFTIDNKKLVTSYEDKVNIQNLSTRKSSSIPYTESIRICSISPHGRWIAVDDQNGIKISDVETGETILDSGVESSSYACFSPDNQWVAVSDMNSVTFFETSSWRKLMRIKSQEIISGITFSSDSIWLAAWGYAGFSSMNYGKDEYLVNLWVWQWEDLFAEASKRVRRNCTIDEWKRYFPDEPYRRTFTKWPSGR